MTSNELTPAMAPRTIGAAEQRAAPGAAGDVRELARRPAAGVEAAGLLDRQRSFTEVLSQRTSADGAKPAAAQAKETAQDFVAMAFVQPLLKQLRETNGAAAPFAPTKGEQQFRALMDAEIARKIVRASDWPLVNRLARNLLEHGQPDRAIDAGPDATKAAGVRTRPGTPRA